jgi:MoaA/NifB/PqqE/SkfB family radical SAM enzyme
MLTGKTCVIPWVSVEVKPTGEFRACCLSTEDITHEGKILTANDTLELAYRSDSMQRLRQQFRNGEQPASCRRCWEQEAAGIVSKRENALDTFKHKLNMVDWDNDTPDQLWFLDLKLGNICNLKCRICGTWSSSKWAQEDIEHQATVDKKSSPAYKQLKLGEWPRKSNAFWNNVEKLLPHIVLFEFTGGEPFLIREHFELLQTAVDGGYAKHINIHYNTNGTTWPANNSIWEKFGCVEIAFSIDNIGDRFNLERSGADWNEVQQNITRAQELKQRANILLQACVTVNIQNVYYLDDICLWLEKQNFNSVYFNILHDPWFMSTARMTKEAQEIVLNKLRTMQVAEHFYNDIQGIIKFIELGTGSDGNEFRKFVKRVDEYRTENFAETHAEIAKAMGYGQT